MSNCEKLQRLKGLQQEVDSIRKELEIHAPEEVLFSSEGDGWDDETIIVEADGFGGATTSVVEGNYPVDYLSKFEKWFELEATAISTAETIASGKAMASEVLDEA